ncbi:hypothetical protein QOT17_011844 [Balamuthia mandrillaris]
MSRNDRLPSLLAFFPVTVLVAAFLLNFVGMYANTESWFEGEIYPSVDNGFAATLTFEFGWLGVSGDIGDYFQDPEAIYIDYDEARYATDHFVGTGRATVALLGISMFLTAVALVLLVIGVEAFGKLKCMNVLSVSALLAGASLFSALGWIVPIAVFSTETDDDDTFAGQLDDWTPKYAWYCVLFASLLDSLAYCIFAVGEVVWQTAIRPSRSGSLVGDSTASSRKEKKENEASEEDEEYQLEDMH